MKKNKLTSLILATTLVLQPVVSTVVLQPAVAFAEEQTVDKAKQTNLTYTGCTYEFNIKSDIKDIAMNYGSQLQLYWVGRDNKLHFRNQNLKDDTMNLKHEGTIVKLKCIAGKIFVQYEDGVVLSSYSFSFGDKVEGVEDIVGYECYKLKSGEYAFGSSLDRISIPGKQIKKATRVRHDSYYRDIVLTEDGELYWKESKDSTFKKFCDKVVDITADNSLPSDTANTCLYMRDDGVIFYIAHYSNSIDGITGPGNTKLSGCNKLNMDGNIITTDDGEKSYIYDEKSNFSEPIETGGLYFGTGAKNIGFFITKDGTVKIQDPNQKTRTFLKFSNDYSKLAELEEDKYSLFQSESLRKVNALYTQCKEQEKALNTESLSKLKSDVNTLEESDAKTELIKNVEQLELVNILKSDIEKAIKSKDDVVINKGVESLNAVDDWGNCEAQRIELTKQLSDKLTDKAEISRLNGDVTRARKCVVNLPSNEASLKNGYLNRLNQIQLLNMDTQIIESVQALANSINETLASKNYTKDSLVTLKEQADTTQATFDNIIEPSVRSRAVSFMAIPYNNLCKTIDEMPDLSTEDSVKDEIIKADKDINKLINIYVTINGLPDDNTNKSKYEELIKKAISDLFKDSSSVDDLVNKIKDAISKGELTKDQVDSIVNGIEDETLRNQIKDKLSSTSKPDDNNSKVTEATEAVIKAEKSKDQKDIDDALTKVNSLPDGLDKDKLMDRINNITNPKPTDPDDTNTPQTVSKDLVVKTNTSNSLELILDTNEITFEDYNGAKDSEKANAVTATVSSSLPFDLNVSQLNEIKSSTGNKMADELLELRKVGTQYTSLGKGNKKVFESNHESGKDIRVPFDIRLKGDSSVKKDNYQTTLRFEAMQK